MLETKYIMERIKSLPDDSIREVIDFVEFLEVKRTGLVEEREKKEGGDPLAKAIGICEGPSDLADGHDK